MSPRPPERRLWAWLLAAALVLLPPLTTGCGGEGGGSGLATFSVWAHAGQEPERRALEATVAAFDASRDDLRVALTLLPEGAYNAQVQAAVLAGDLPDLLEFDGPFLAAYVAQGQLAPIAGLLADSLLADILPTLKAQGSVGDSLYALGLFDSGLGLYARRSRLAAVGARLPAGPGDAWTVDEFETILADLAASDPDGAVLDLKLNYRGEWYTYAFLPWFESAGAGLVGGDSPRAAGTLDGPAALRVASTFQRWLKRGWVDPDLDDAAFTEGRAAIGLGGHWNHPAYAAAWGEDLVVLPPPDWGRGSRSGQGSWQWGVTRGADSDAAAAFLAALFSPASVARMGAANGAVPGRLSVLAISPLYAEDGPLRLFVEQLLGGHARPRPISPVYPYLTSRFQELIEQLRDGAPPAAALAAAARDIDAELSAAR